MNQVKGSLQRAIYYIYGFFVLWEWLRPLDKVTDTGNLSIFLYFVALSYLFTYFSLPFLVAFSVKVLFIVYFIHDLFYEGSFLQLKWVPDFFNEFVANITFALSANWWEMTNSFRSILFFILLWLSTYLMEYWIVQLKKILLFLLMTITYLAVLDTFTAYDSDSAIIRMIVFGFIILGLLKLERLKENESIHVNKKLWMKWLVPLTIITLVTTSVGYFAPKAAPQWPDPIPYLKGYGEGNGVGGVKRIGYGTNDSRLGGPFIGDDTVVFRVESADREYWRVETKDFYTGKGWEVSSTNIVTETDEDAISFPALEPSIETIPSKATIKMKLGYPHIIYPVELQSVKTDYEMIYNINTETQKVMTERSGQPFSLEEYEVVYNDPQYIMEELKASSFDYPEELSKYTQLPEVMPKRVKALAEEIIAPYSNRYDQVKAVESYFRINGFKYETMDVAVPGKDDDYVDQFLFETKNGYCDNFSTSMIVLLRSVGIPSRWVKGYTSGDYVETTSENTRLYEVRNDNAHSWVEVFFPGTGWVPFEPTIGFSNPYRFTSNQEQDDIQIPVPNVNQQQPDRPEEDLLSEQDAGDESTSSKSWTLDITLTDVLKVAGVLFVLAAILYFTRRKWLPIYILRRYGKFNNPHSFEKAYFVLIKFLERYGLKKKESQTLREYALYVDEFFISKDMRKLTMKLEGIQYRKGSVLEEKDVKTMRELWENLIKRIAS